MEIKILGPGCTKCNKLYRETQEALSETGVSAQLTKVERIDEIMTYGVAITPGLVINGKVVSVGKVPRRAQIAEWIRTAAG